MWQDLAKNRNFGKISSFRQIFQGLFCIWQNFEPTFGQNNAIGQIFAVGLILNK